jgi:hypothetical protein
MLPLIPALLSLAPTLIDLFAGDKTGAIAKKVVAVAGDVMGVKGDAVAIDAAIAGLPPEKRIELQIAMAKLAADERAAQRKADLDEMVARFADTADARGQTVDLAKIGSPLAYGAALVSSLVLITFGFVLYLILTAKIPAGQEQLLNVMLGALTTMASAVVGYWVGSSAGSARKDTIIAASPAVGAKPN